VDSSNPTGNSWKTMETNSERGWSQFIPKEQIEKYKYMWKQLEQLHHEQGQ